MRRAAFTAALLVALVAASGVSPLPADASGHDRADSELHVVVLDETPLGLRPAGERGQLAIAHARALAAIGRALGREAGVVFRYEHALAGLALPLTAAQAAAVSRLPGVLHVEREETLQVATDSGPAWTGAPAVWDGSATGGAAGSMGEGVVVGVVDTGIDPAHPSFEGVGPVDGHLHVNPKGSYLGACHPITGLPYCNPKLIGAYDFTFAGSPVDQVGHGTHVASTAAGNVVTVVLVAPTTVLPLTLSGVAPHANLVSYRACVDDGRFGCPSSAIIASIDQAVADGVDVLNISLGGSARNPWTSAIALALLNAVEAGVFVAASAGNSGPSAGTISDPANAPWVTAVGASTHDRELVNALVDLTGGGPPPGDLHGASVTGGYGPAPIVHASTVGDRLCRTPFPAGTWTGEIVVCDRGENPRVEKAENVAAGGAGGFVLVNEVSDGESVVADAYVIPGVHLGRTAGSALTSWLASGSGHQGRIEGTEVVANPVRGDVMASFSARGPNTRVPGVVKPDLTAPGVDVIAAWAGGAAFNVASGTSMSSPHVAGAAALVRAVHPAWSADEVRSALMTTAFSQLPGRGTEVHDVLLQDATTPAGPFAYGAGRVDLRAAAAAGIVLSVPGGAYRDADPALGGDPTTLNLASLADDDCEDACSWSRVVTSTMGSTVTWAAVSSTPAGMTISVHPAEFTLAPGASRALTVTADVTGLVGGTWTPAAVTLVPDDPSVPPATLPVMVVQTGSGSVNQAPVAGDVDTFAITSTPRLVHVLDAASDPDGDELVVEAVVVAPSDGVAEVTADGSAVVYTSADGFTGSDGFVVLVADGRGGSDTATVTVEVYALGDVSRACDGVPPSGMDDVAGNFHEATIDCIVWWQISVGKGDGTYEPGALTQRDQMASFLARVLEQIGIPLPQDPPSLFPDVEGNTHELAINQLAELSLVQGFDDGTYRPGLPIERRQMATLLVRLFEWVDGRELSHLGSYFTDIAGDHHEEGIVKAREAGFTTGVTDTTYAPHDHVQRDQMASFLARLLDRLVRDGHGSPPS